MAKPGALESDPTVTAKAMELKKELQRLVKSIVEDEDHHYGIETIDTTMETLSLLKELKLSKRSSTVTTTTTPAPSSSSLSLKLRHKTSLNWPEEFKCPLSKQLMRDPVIVASGQVSAGIYKCGFGVLGFAEDAANILTENHTPTYDRTFIQKWLKAGNRTCPRTQQVLSHTVLTPNYLISEMIEQWCRSQGIEFSNHVHYINEEAILEPDHGHFLSLLEKVSSSALSEQKAAAKELRILTKKMPSFRVFFSEFPDAIPKLLKPICGSHSLGNVHPDLQEDVITTILNISIHDNNKKLVADTPMVIPLLMRALRSGTIATRSNAAAALFTLSALDLNKELIGKSGALKPLIDLLEEGHPLAMKDVASAIFTLCVLQENKARAVKDGMVKVIVKKIVDRVYVDELLAILALLSSHQKAIQDMGELGAVASLLSLIRETNCERNKENCIAILLTICLFDRTRLKEMKEEENRHRTISELAQNGTSRAKRKAAAILERLNRVVNITHTA